MRAVDFFALSLAFAGQSWASPVETRQTSSPCAQAASAAAAFKKQNPSAPQVVIPAELAFQCLTSVPLHTEPAIDLVQSLQGYFQIQSTIDYLRQPPDGWLFPAADLPRSLDQIWSQVQNGQYNSEYDLLVDLNTLIFAAKDGHFSAQWDLFSNIFVFERPNEITLISVSKDGKELPKVYLFSDVIAVDQTGNYHLTNAPASAVSQINGLDVDVFLQTQSSFLNSQDPDSQYNQVIFTLGQSSLPSTGLPIFNTPIFYPGPETVLSFENGTTTTTQNVAVVTKDLTGITDGNSLYQAFCVPLTMPSYSSAAATGTPTAAGAESVPTASASASATPTQFPGYPVPEVVDSSGLISGYFLDDQVAVLAIRSFEGDNADFTQEFQDTLEAFLVAATKAGMKKLIIDLMGNPGGFIDLGTELLAQLFPNSSPDTKSNMRGSTGMYLLTEAASNIAEAAINEEAKDHNETAEANSIDNTIPFSFQGVITPDERDFMNFHDFYGPHPQANGVFTSFFQTNFTNDIPSEAATGPMNVTGYGNRGGARQQPFDTQNIIVLTDGFCASTCTVVSEGLKNNHGVQFIVVGGRPQTGPMQAVGGVKGSQIFDTSVLQMLLTWWDNPGLVDQKQAMGSPFENFDTTPLERGLSGVNGRNHYRFGDTSTTPLQFVYEAADCRIWNTAETLTNITALWDRVSTLAFQDRNSAGVITSEYCVTDSTKQPTSISGGLKKGELGPQTPPANAKPQHLGFLEQGKKIVDTLVNTGPSVPPNTAFTENSDTADTKPISQKALASIQTACHGYTGDRWFVQVVCGALG